MPERALQGLRMPLDSRKCLILPLGCKRRFVGHPRMPCSSLGGRYGILEETGGGVTRRLSGAPRGHWVALVYLWRIYNYIHKI